ncbi:membrane steroid-binding 2-like [Olea europaea subsp. europaea]|uniref:Membrane steroid-binding 2-like n=1 Tax=Olea europaea subsp. europaea TaxID=158383 RepID=A0A8S0TH54_OLEEU|nr:membrane steroid-binding 2-like [Olea europaea subsp. europaea]
MMICSLHFDNSSSDSSGHSSIVCRTLFAAIMAPVFRVLIAVYYTLSSLFGSSDDGHPRSRGVEEQMEPLPPPAQLGEITDEVLKQYDGYDPKKPLLMAIKGQIYDVSQSRHTFLIFVNFCVF